MTGASQQAGTAARRERILRIMLGLGIAGVIVLGSLFGWYLWRESVVSEEQRLQALGQRLGNRAESILLDARQLLERLNVSTLPRCSEQYLEMLQVEAIARPHVRAIGHWKAVERLCGAGFVQSSALTPPAASRIYPNGIVAWWPGPGTAIGDVQLFLMRLGEHDLAIDTRLLLGDRLPQRFRAGLWVEGLLLASDPPVAELPAPEALPEGLTMGGANREIIVRLKLDTVIPMDLVVVQSASDFWARYLPTLITAAGLGLLLMGLWFVFVYHLSRRHLSLTAELREAIENDSIEPVYQPIISLATGKCCGAEILARWRREEGEVISPAVFIPIAENAGMIRALTLSLLTRAVRETAEFLHGAPDLTLNLNLSSQDLEDAELPDKLTRVLERYNLPASALKLEITERGLLDKDSCRECIRKMRARGHKIAIDDFGTGYSSLAYLESFELDTLKLDKAFVDAIESHAVTSSVIGHIIEMGRSLNLDMVAEGVESEHQSSWLSANGVQMVQGFLYSKPLSASGFIAFCRREQRQGKL